MKYRQCVLGLILVSPLCKAPSWTEWLYNKVLFPSLKECVINIDVMFAEIFLIFAGDVKAALFLWHVWGGKGYPAEAVL